MGSSKTPELRRLGVQITNADDESQHRLFRRSPRQRRRGRRHRPRRQERFSPCLTKCSTSSQTAPERFGWFTFVWSVRYVLVKLLVVRLETVLRPLVSTVLAPIRVTKIINLDNQRYLRFNHHGRKSRSGGDFLHLRFYLLTADELLADQSYLEPSPTRGATSEECPHFF